MHRPRRLSSVSAREGRRSLSTPTDSHAPKLTRTRQTDVCTHAAHSRAVLDPCMACARRGMRDVVAAARAGERGAFTLSHLRIGDVLLEVTELVRMHQV